MECVISMQVSMASSAAFAASLAGNVVAPSSLRIWDALTFTLFCSGSAF